MPGSNKTKKLARQATRSIKIQAHQITLINAKTVTELIEIRARRYLYKN